MGQLELPAGSDKIREVTAWQVIPRFTGARLLKFERHVLKLIPLIYPESFSGASSQAGLHYDGNLRGRAPLPFGQG